MNAFHNTGKLFRFALKRERVNSTLWILGLSLFSVGLALGMGKMFDDAARQALAITLNNPGIVAMMGPVYGAENYTVGAMYANCMFQWVAIASAVMNIFLVVRHTRTDEENGCREFLAALPVGRLSGLSSALLTAVTVNTAIGILHWLGIAMVGEASLTFGGCAIYGATMMMIGLVFAGVAAVFSQLCATSRGATGCSLGVMGAMYLLRAVGDMGNETLSVLSPLGLIQRTEVFTADKIYPVFVLLAEAAVLAAAAFILNAHRDFGQGYIPAKSGRKNAPKSLSSPFGLSLRLLKNSLLMWLAVMFVFAAAYGAVLGDIETFVAESPLYQQIMGINGDYSAAMMFVSMVNSILSLLCIAPVVSAVLKMQREEKSGRLEYVLSRPVSRTDYLRSFQMLAVNTTVLLEVAAALGLYAAAQAVLEESIPLSFFLKSILVYVPAIWVMIGLAVFLIGWFPKFTAAVWGYFGFSFFTCFLGRMLDLPKWLKALSPFYYVPQLPVDKPEILPLGTLTVIAAVLMLAGRLGFEKRDVQSV